MHWGCFAVCGPAPLVQIDGIMNSAQNQEISAKAWLPLPGGSDLAIDGFSTWGSTDNQINTESDEQRFSHSLNLNATESSGQNNKTSIVNLRI